MRPHCVVSWHSGPPRTQQRVKGARSPHESKLDPKLDFKYGAKHGSKIDSKRGASLNPKQHQTGCILDLELDFNQLRAWLQAPTSNITPSSTKATPNIAPNPTSNISQARPMNRFGFTWNENDYIQKSHPIGWLSSFDGVGGGI